MTAFIALQLALVSMQRAGREKPAMKHFLKDATHISPNLKEAVQAMVTSKHFVGEAFTLSDFADD